MEPITIHTSFAAGKEPFAIRDNRLFDENHYETRYVSLKSLGKIFRSTKNLTKNVKKAGSVTIRYPYSNDKTSVTVNLQKNSVAIGCKVFSGNDYKTLRRLALKASKVSK